MQQKLKVCKGTKGLLLLPVEARISLTLTRPCRESGYYVPFSEKDSQSTELESSAHETWKSKHGYAFGPKVEMLLLQAAG